jgi:hypothetical protein
VWNTFSVLSRQRPTGLAGPGAIRLSEIETYCRLHGYHGESRQRLVRLIQVLDEEFLAYVAEEATDTA